MGVVGGLERVCWISISLEYESDDWSNSSKFTREEDHLNHRSIPTRQPPSEVESEA